MLRAHSSVAFSLESAWKTYWIGMAEKKNSTVVGSKKSVWPGSSSISYLEQERLEKIQREEEAAARRSAVRGATLVRARAAHSIA